MVKSLKQLGKHLQVDKELKLCRSIGIEFGSELFDELQIYNLFEQQIVDFDPKTHKAILEMSLPNSLPSSEQFDIWVNQSINRSALGHFENLTSELSLSSRLNSLYLCDSSFSHDVLGLNLAKNSDSIPKNTIQHLLEMDLEFLTNVSAEDLMSIRLNDGEAFSLFRSELEKQLRELRHEKDPIILKQKIEDASHELTEVQLSKINSKIKNLRKGALSEAGLALVGLGASFATSGSSLIAVLLAAAGGYKSYSEYQEKVKGNPCYFLWKLKN